MDLTEHTVASQTLFEGKIVKLTLDQARLPDGTLELDPLGTASRAQTATLMMRLVG